VFFNVSTNTVKVIGEDSFTGHKTQPTVSNHWRKRRNKGKENPENANNTKYSNTI